MISIQRLEEIIKKFNSVRIAVIGDMSMYRLSDPLPILSTTHFLYFLGHRKYTISVRLSIVTHFAFPIIRPPNGY